MNPITEIQTIGSRLATLQSSEDALYEAVRSLDHRVAHVLKDGNEKRAIGIRPVNLLRYEILRRVLSDEQVGPEVISEVQAAIVNRDASLFPSTSYPDGFARNLRQSSPKPTVFKSWKVGFRVCYPFFYTNDDRDRVRELLDEIANDAKRELQLESHRHTFFDFDGPNNFGDIGCWLAIFPYERGSHTNAFQLFLRIDPESIQSGLFPGKNVGSKKERKLSRAASLQDAIRNLREFRERYLKLNKRMVSTWKFAPGEGADHWDEFYEGGIMAIGFDEGLGDLRKYGSRTELGDALGLETPENSNDVWNMASFRDAAIGDIVVANRGRRTAVGIGVIEGEYEYHSDRGEFWHVRKTRWLVSTELSFEKVMFRVDTFSPTLKWREVKERLLQEHPELADDLEKIESGRAESDGQVPSGNLHGLRVALGRSIRHDWVKPIRGLAPAIEAALKATGGPINVEETAAGEHAIRRGLRSSCEAAAREVNPDHPVYPHIHTILKLTSAGNQHEMYTREQAYSDSGLDEDTFAAHWALLQEKRQVVLQGPPGTGKTYLANIYGRLLVAGDMYRLEVVQFHPSYSYEDFVEGYRPTAGGGLDVREGIFKLVCEKARESADPTVLIIDEINRGDLSKIFGELLYLLEYREKQIKLTHNPNVSFEIPRNLYLIGTMNTADRSLALIDYALRRRFSFISLEPQYDLVRRLVRAEEFDIDRLIGNFMELNREIAGNTTLGADFEIGHSYLLRHRNLTRVKLERVWRFDIGPLLREYYFDAQEQLPRLRELFFDGLAGA